MASGSLTPKEIVENCRILLLKNLVLTPELVDHMKKNNVITDLSLQEIQEKEGKEEQNKVLLEQLSVKGRYVLERLTESLQMCGFNILADMLRDQLSMKDSQLVEITDLQKRAPRVDKALDRREKDDLNVYINQKVHEYSIKAAWQKDTVPDKEKALLAKQKQLEETWKYTEIIADKDNTIKQLSEQLEQAFNDAEKKGVHLQNVSQYLNQLKKKHEEDMKIQIKYNEANDNSLRRQAAQHGAMEKEVEVLVAKVNDCLRSGNQLPEKKGPLTRRPSMMSHEEAMIVTAVDKMKYSLDKLIKHTTELQVMKQYFEKLQGDSYYVLTHLGRDTNSDLRQSFQSFIVENEEMTVGLRNKIELLRRELEQKDLTVKEQIENYENKFRDLESQQEELMSESLQKDSKIKSLQAEIEKLKKTIAQLEKQLASKNSSVPLSNSNKRPSTPRFKDYEDEENKVPSPPQRITPIREFNKNMKTTQSSVHLPSIYKGNKSPTRHHNGLFPKPHNTNYRTPQAFQSNPENPFIVHAISGAPHPVGGSHHGGLNRVGKVKPLGNHQNTYGKQQSVEVEMKKGLPYYR